jgi:hypothetical protein
MNRIIIHTDASNITNSGKCKMSAVIERNNKKQIIIKYFKGKINQAELIIVLYVLKYVEKNYIKNENYEIFLYSDHLPNVKFFNKILNNKDIDIDKIKKILKRKNLTFSDLDILKRLNINNNLNISWISRKQNSEADRFSKEI